MKKTVIFTILIAAVLLVVMTAFVSVKNTAEKNICKKAMEPFCEEKLHFQVPSYKI